MSDEVLRIRNLSKLFRVGKHTVHAVDGFSANVNRGECLAIVGESGSGKTTLANMLLGIHAPNSGEIVLEGEHLPLKRELRHRRLIQLVQQNPLSSLNPKRSVGSSIRLALDVHKMGSPSSRVGRIGDLLGEVGLPENFASRSPDALSGGERQRVAIARALACESTVLVLDEPTSALDVLVQARVLRLLNELRSRRNLTYIFITHDLAVVSNMADRVAVLKNGQLVELEPTDRIFSEPGHPYTRNLLSACPVISAEEVALRDRLRTEGN